MTSATPLAEHVTDREVDALSRRCARLAGHGVLPCPRGDYPAIPWPPVLTAG